MSSFSQVYTAYVEGEGVKGRCTYAFQKCRSRCIAILRRGLKINIQITILVGREGSQKNSPMYDLDNVDNSRRPLMHLSETTEQKSIPVLRKQHQIQLLSGPLPSKVVLGRRRSYSILRAGLRYKKQLNESIRC